MHLVPTSTHAIAVSPDLYVDNSLRINTATREQETLGDAVLATYINDVVSSRL